MCHTNDLFRRAGARSRRHSVRTVGDACPYIKRTSVCILSYQKSVAGSGTQPQVSRQLFCFFFLRLKKEDTPHSRGRLSLQLPSPSANAATSPEGRGFKFVIIFRLLLKPPLLCKGGGFEHQREDGGIVFQIHTKKRLRADERNRFSR